MLRVRFISVLALVLFFGTYSLQSYAQTAQPTATPAVGGMDPFRKDVIDAASKIGGVVGVFVAIFVAYTQVKKNRQEAVNSRQQREEELRWRKSNLAREIIKDLWEGGHTSAAITMLIWSGREYTIKGTTVTIGGQEVWQALRTQPTNYTATEKYIRESFSHLFGVMDTTEHNLTIGLIAFEDVEYPFRLIAAKLQKHSEVVESFLDRYEFTRAKSFLQRFS